MLLHGRYRHNALMCVLQILAGFAEVTCAPVRPHRMVCLIGGEKLRPLLMAASAALFAIFDMFAGMIDPMALTFLPMIALKRTARLLRSSYRTARASAAWSSNESSDVWLGADGTVGMPRLGSPQRVAAS